MEKRVLCGLGFGFVVALAACAHDAGRAHAGEPGDAKAKRAPLDETGGKKISNPRGGVTWQSGKPGVSLSARPGPWASAFKRSSAKSSSRLVLRQKKDTSAPQGFVEYTPQGYPGSAKWPLLIALHGVGENGNGNDGLKVLTEHGIPRVIAENRWKNDRPHVVLAPQHSSYGCHKPENIKKFISWAVQNYPIDPRYVYIAGYSCGANAIWDYLAESNGSQVAAAVVIAGKGQPAWQKKGCALGNVAIWGFHGHKDNVVDPAGTNVPLDGLAACSSKPRGYKKTIYPERGHDAWFRTFGDMSGHDIYSWMLTYRKN